MGIGSCLGTKILLVALSWLSIGTEGIRFVLDREECLSHNVPYGADVVHVSFVVIKAATPWHTGEEGTDLLIKGPSGETIHSFIDKTSEKYEFMAQKRGLYRFCFKNKSLFHETVDFDVHVGHLPHYDQHAEDETLSPLLEQISKLGEPLYNIQFEQHWLDAQSDRQAILNTAMGQRVVQKAIFESAALVGASILQVYLLRRLFDRKLGSFRV